MRKFLSRTKGAVAPLALIVVLGSQSMAQNYRNDNVQNRENNESNISRWYGGLGLNMTTASGDDCEDITYGFTARVGYDFNSYLGIEGRAIRTNWEYEGAKVEHYGVFVKPMYPISEDLSVYALLGYGKTSTGNKNNFDDSGMAWGVGLNFYLDNEEERMREANRTREPVPYQQQQPSHDDEKEDEELLDDHQGLGLFVDYERLLQKSDVPDFDTISVGVTYDF